jgi:hypothetical protein
MKMEGFLSKLPAERVFHTWGGEPSAEEHAKRIAAAANNIQLAVRYMRCKLYSSSVIEALASESGGDAPLPYFIGGTPETPGANMKRLEQFIPAPTGEREDLLDPVLRQLLQGGRATTSSFDITPSPVADYLYVMMGEARLMKGLLEARSMWDATISPRMFLSLQPREPMIAIAKAAGEMAPTRAGALAELMKLL